MNVHFLVLLTIIIENGVKKEVQIDKNITIIYLETLKLKILIFIH